MPIQETNTATQPSPAVANATATTSDTTTTLATSTPTSDTAIPVATTAVATPHLDLLQKLEDDLGSTEASVDAAGSTAIAGIKATVESFIAKMRALFMAQHPGEVNDQDNG
jgi:hypothetical protein